MTCITYYAKYLFSPLGSRVVWVNAEKRRTKDTELGTRWIYTMGQLGEPVRILTSGQIFIFINLKRALRRARGGEVKRAFRAPKRIFSWRKYFYVSFNAPKMVPVWSKALVPAPSPPSHRLLAIAHLLQVGKTSYSAHVKLI